MRAPKALILRFLLALALAACQVFSYCECGYRAWINTNHTVAGSEAVTGEHGSFKRIHTDIDPRLVDPAFGTSYIYTDLLETDFLHSDSIAKNTDWQIQNYSVTAAANRGRFGMEFNTANVKLNRIEDPKNWTGPGEFGGDPGLQMSVESNVTTAGFTLCAQINSARQDMMDGTFRALIKLPPVSGTCSAFFWYHNDSEEIDMELLSSQFNRNKDEFLVNLVHQSTQSAAQGFSVIGKDYQVVSLPVDPTSGFHEYRIDYTDGIILFYIDSLVIGAMNSTKPDVPGHLILTQWSNGDPGWSGGPPVAPAVLSVGYVKAYFNSSDPVRQGDAERRCNDPSEPGAVCDIEDYTPPANITSLVNNLQIPALDTPFFSNRENMTNNQTVHRSDGNTCQEGNFLRPIGSLIMVWFFLSLLRLLFKLLDILVDYIHEDEAADRYDEEAAGWYVREAADRH
ncbi:related to xyloglucan endo-transglycosylase-like protein [Rhynchosporium agropyri]|uniref:Related to xyloglucan endo-transglycosylase-like protein n=1 Tax=Rhynchosporium agropyri TaxID=914238 RepID=A0A1E1KXZ8_9HELO|nr:related to xyloglucan endo-transglycosylase-like protein [Rhynchosporium agropyri]